MKAEQTDKLYTHIRTSDTVTATPKLTMEWNYNMLVPVTASNIISETNEGFDVDLFPIESIVEPYRPSRGIVKGLVGEARVSKAYYDHPNASRYYVASAGDIYKYWISADQTDDDGNFPESIPGFTNVRPTVTYGNVEPSTVNIVNKIVIGLETGQSYPTKFYLETQSDKDADWIVIGDQDSIKIQNNGTFTLYAAEDSSWSQNVELQYGVPVRSIRLCVQALDQPKNHLSLIEMSARLERDLSAYVVTVNDTFSMGDTSELTPIGKASSNDGTLTLYNELVDPDDPVRGLLFNNDNPSSPYHNMIDSRAKATLSYVYMTIGSNGNPKPFEIPQFEMYTENWTGQTQGTLSINLRDRSIQFQEAKVPKTMFTGKRVTEIIFMLCDLMGFVDYIIEEGEEDNPAAVPYFWTTGEQTLWEVLADLGEGTQTAVYFDAIGQLRIKTREAAFDPARLTDWTARAQNRKVNGLVELADLSDYNQTEQYEANAVTVTYQITEISDFNNGIPEMQQVWEPADTTVLRTAPLAANLATTAEFVVLNPRDAKIWPFTGIMQIEGELIKYDGKQYIYYENKERKKAIVHSIEEQQKYDGKNGNNRSRNNYSGKFVITERGYLNSDPKPHFIEADGYTVYDVDRPLDGSGGVSQTKRFFAQNKKHSLVTIDTPTNFRYNRWAVATHGQIAAEGFYSVGTSIRFEKKRVGQQAGIVFNSGAFMRGYYVELRPTDKVSKSNDQSPQLEVSLYSMRMTGAIQRFGGQDKKIDGNTVAIGVPHLITEDIWTTVDVWIQLVNGNDHSITVMVDGQVAFGVTIPSSSVWWNPMSGRFGLFARGRTTADFDYLYGISRIDKTPPDDVSFLDRITGGYIGNQLQKEWVYKMRDPQHRGDKKNGKTAHKFNQMFIDEFGPMVHEVREFDVVFDPAPCMHSFLYVTNDSQILCPQYSSNPFGAKFMLVNAARQNAILEGDDTLTFPGNTVSQKAIIFGRVVTQQDAQTVVVTDDESIKRHGRIELEFQSKWIQSEKQANALGNWVTRHWSGGNDQCEVTLFGNTLIEIGDIVGIDYAERDMTADNHQYFVVGVQTSFDAGIETVLTLRRRVVHEAIIQPDAPADGGDGGDPGGPPGDGDAVFSPDWIMI